MSRSPVQDHNLGRMHQGNFLCTIGSLPVSYEQTDAPPEEAINGSINSFIVTGLDLRYEKDSSYKATVHIPVTEDNYYYDKVLTINMIADDRLENYYALRRYMRTIQSGQTNGFPITELTDRVRGFDGVYRNRLTWIPQIDIKAADDSKQKHQTFRYMRCYPTAISDINAEFKGPDPVTFMISFIFSYEEMIREVPPNEDTVPPIGVID